LASGTFSRQDSSILMIGKLQLELGLERVLEGQEWERPVPE
jgi:hypothetical protein